jgi:hypothetical protein
LRAIINPSRDVNQNIALALLFTCASALGAGLGNNSTFTAALVASSGVGEAAEEALLDSAHLPSAITVGASGGLTARFAANTLAQQAVLGAGYGYLFFTTQGGFLKGDGNSAAEVGTTLWCLVGGSGSPAKEGVEDIAEAAKVKALKASPEKSFGTTVAKAVIGSPLIWGRERFIGFVYLFESFPRLIIMIVVGVIFKG